MKRWWPLLVLALLVAAFFAGFTLQEQSHDRGYSAEARLNPWLAAGRVLEKQGQHIRFAPAYGSLPRHADVIALATPIEYLDEKEQISLLDWVKNGGHLITEMQNVSEEGAAPDDTDLLYKTLGVSLYDATSAEAQESEEANGETGTKAQADATGNTPNSSPNAEAAEKPVASPASNKTSNSRFLTTQIDNEGEIRSTLDPDYYLRANTRKPDWVVYSEQGPQHNRLIRHHALRFTLGQGHITVLSDMSWMRNQTLGDFDNAALLFRVVNAKPTATVWLIHGEQRPSLFSLLWEHAALLLKAIALFVLVWLWQASRRFGPLQLPVHSQRRRLSEHLEASGRYLLQQGALSKLHAASRQRLLAQVQRQHPQWRRLSTPELARQISLRAHIESAAIQRVLTETASTNLLQFAADIRLLNRLRKAL